MTGVDVDIDAIARHFVVVGGALELSAAGAALSERAGVTETELSISSSRVAIISPCAALVLLVICDDSIKSPAHGRAGCCCVAGG